MIIMNLPTLYLPPALLDSSLVSSGADERVCIEVVAHCLSHAQRLGCAAVQVLAASPAPLEWGGADHAHGGGGGDALAGGVSGG